MPPIDTNGHDDCGAGREGGPGTRASAVGRIAVGRLRCNARVLLREQMSIGRADERLLHAVIKAAPSSDDGRVPFAFTGRVDPGG